jgi:hypothetical protein
MQQNSAAAVRVAPDKPSSHLRRGRVTDNNTQLQIRYCIGLFIPVRVWDEKDELPKNAAQLISSARNTKPPIEAHRLKSGRDRDRLSTRRHTPAAACHAAELLPPSQ